MSSEKRQERRHEAESAAQSTTRKRRWRRPAAQTCHCCGRSMPFCWHCRCGFDICQSCMNANVWGMSCNHITWQCPDCGGLNGFGNQ